MDIQWIKRHDPIQEKAAQKWEQGLPLGNGKIGAMVWGGSARQPLIVSLDQAQIWELHPYIPPENKTWRDYKKLLEEGRGGEVQGFSGDWNKPHAMRIPVGRLELFPREKIIMGHTSRLDLIHGRCLGNLQTEKGEIPYKVWICANRQVAVAEYEKKRFCEQSSAAFCLPGWRLYFRGQH